MGSKKTQRIQCYYVNLRTKLVSDFGGKCEHCGIPAIEVSDSVLAEKLEFAHRIGERISGNNRGRNSRLREVRNNPSRFLLLCRKCHKKYDAENPLSDYELEKI